MPWECSWAFLNDEGQVEHFIHKTMFETAPDNIRVYLAQTRPEGVFSQEEEEFLLRRYADASPVPDQIVFAGVDPKWDREDSQANPMKMPKVNQSRETPPPPPPPRKSTMKNSKPEPEPIPLPTPVQPRERDSPKSLGQHKPPPPPPPAKKLEKTKGKAPQKDPIKKFKFKSQIEASDWKYGPKQIEGACTSTKSGFNIIVHSNEKPVKFESQQTNSGSAEIVFLIDSSGSMGDEMDAVKKTCTAFAEHIQREANSTTQLALVTYGKGHAQHFSGATSTDHGEYNTTSWPLMTPSDFHSVVNKHLKVGISGGGGCYVAGPGTAVVFQEVLAQFSSHGLLKGIGKALSRNHAKFIIHISDEFDYTLGEVDLPQILRDCKEHSVVVHTMGRDSRGHKEISKETGGVFWDIAETQGEGDLSTILTEVSSEIAKALSVQNKMSKGKKSGPSGPSCTQTDSARRSKGGEMEGGTGRTRPKSEDDDTWSFIRDFKCHFCESSTYAICPDCATHLCFGGVQKSGSEHFITCPDCTWNGEIDFVEEAQSSAKNRSFGKGKK